MNLLAQYYGDESGSTDRYYWVIPNFPHGPGTIYGPVKVTTIATLDGNNKVLVKWTREPGAINYAVLRTTTSTTPKTGSIALKTSVEGQSFTDDGSITPFSYDVAALSSQIGVLVAKATYDASVDATSHTTNSGVVTPAKTAQIPSGALVISAFINVIVAVTSGGSATLSVGTTAGSSATSLLGATAKGSLTLGAQIIGAPQTTPFIMSAEGSIDVTIGTADLTAGKVEVIVLYVIP